MDPVTSPVAATRALREARVELGAALLALTLTAPTRAAAARAADAARLHVTGAANPPRRRRGRREHPSGR